MYVSELQRARLLDATFAVVAEQGYRGMAVRAVTERAGVSAKTFYDLFQDREDCFLAAFDHGVDRLEVSVRPAYEGEGDWVAGIRAGLGALLDVLDREPALRTLVFVEALGAGPRVLARRAEVLQELAGLIDEGREGSKDAGELPALLAEGLVGATFGVLHARLLQPGLGPLGNLLNELMATIVLPYRGRAAAKRELRGTGTFSSGRKNSAGVKSPARLAEGQTVPPIDVPKPLGSVSPASFRLTVRTQTVLAALAELNGRGSSPSNQELSQLAGISDQGQISRMMMRLQQEGLLENTGGHGQGAPKAWCLSPAGQDLLRDNPPLRSQRTPTRKGKPSAGRGSAALAERGAGRSRSNGSAHPARRTDRRSTGSPIGQHASDRLSPNSGGRRPIAAAKFRLTALTHEVLTAVADLEGAHTPPSNVDISKAAGVKDQGQISRLLARLEGLGLLQNTGGATAGVPNAWRLTEKGEAVLSVSTQSTCVAPSAGTSNSTKER
jgi:AcrR family transcriptional regulator/DNA-binding MarR family transcriptional regulator